MPDLQLGDPVMDAAQGRPMVVLDVPDQTVAEWSEANGYDLQSNYANGKFDPDPDEGVVECVYVSDVRSEPSKTYTFPRSRVVLIDAHHADDGRRIADRVAFDLLADLFDAAYRSGSDSTLAMLEGLAQDVVGKELATAAREYASVEHEVTADA